MEIFDHVSVREVEKGDINFLFNSFIKCLSKYTESFFNGWQHKDITDYLEYIFIWALNQPKYSVFIACSKVDSTQIIGYVIANSSDNEIFFQYTKYGYRKLGVQKHILLPLCVDETKPTIVNWATKEAKRFVSKEPHKISIKQQFVYTLLKEKT